MTTENQTTGSNPVSADDRARMEELAQRLRTASGGQDKFAEWVAENWQRTLAVAAIIMLIFYLYRYYHDSIDQRNQEAAEIFSALQNALNQQEVTPEIEQTVSSQLRVLSENYSASSYAELSPIYRALAAYKSGDLALAATVLDETSNTIGKVQLKPSTEFNISTIRDEFGLLLKAKIFLENSNDRHQAVPVLIQLIENGSLTVVEALLTMARLADSGEDIGKVKQLAEAAKNKHPYYADIIDREFIRLGLPIKASS